MNTTKSPALRLLFLLCLTVGWMHCVPPERNVDRDTSIDLSDREVQRIFDYQDKRMGDSLLPYLGHSRASYRMLAARAFGSIRDKSFVDTLIGLLDDPVAEVREFSAFALGQTGDERAEEFLVNAFEREDSSGYFYLANSAILEAVGKCGGPKYLNALATISSYSKQDTLLLLGQARGIYQYALRGITLSEATDRMISFAVDPEFPSPVRLMATQYLARTRNISYDAAVPDLILRLRKEGDPEIRMALAAALGKSRLEAARVAIAELFPDESDYRVRCNMVKAMDNFSAQAVREFMLSALRDPRISVAQIAADHFIENGKEADALTYRQLARDTFHWSVRARLFQAANRHIPYFYTITKNNLRFEITQQIRNARNAYNKASLLRALAEDPRNYTLLIEEANDSTNAPVVRTSAAEALGAITADRQLSEIFRGAVRNVESQLFQFFREACLSGDAGLTAVAGGVFQRERIPWQTDDWEFIKEGMKKLSLPAEIESYTELQKAYKKRTGQDPGTADTEFRQPISWTVLSRIQDSTEAVINTTSGEIAIRFYPELAPGSVANFLQLAQSGFFDGKVFHRVVPNFVAQGGCPRGDGYGSLDYTIRTETGRVYYDQSGMVGMASAGPDTEGTQFFITHSPTPHLDGRYTIFARVTRGMETVHRIQQGETIKNIILNGLQ